MAIEYKIGTSSSMGNMEFPSSIGETTKNHHDNYRILQPLGMSEPDARYLTGKINGNGSGIGVKELVQAKADRARRPLLYNGNYKTPEELIARFQELQKAKNKNDERIRDSISEIRVSRKK